MFHFCLSILWNNRNQDIFSAVAGAVKHFDYISCGACAITEILVWGPGGTISGKLTPGLFFLGLPWKIGPTSHRNWVTTCTILLSNRLVFQECIILNLCSFDIIAFQWKTPCIYSSPDPSLSPESGSVAWDFMHIQWNLWNKDTAGQFMHINLAHAKVHFTQTSH